MATQATTVSTADFEAVAALLDSDEGRRSLANIKSQFLESQARLAEITSEVRHTTGEGKGCACGGGGVRGWGEHIWDEVTPSTSAASIRISVWPSHGHYVGRDPEPLRSCQPNPGWAQD